MASGFEVPRRFQRLQFFHLQIKADKEENILLWLRLGQYYNLRKKNAHNFILSNHIKYTDKMLLFDICLTVHHWYKSYRQPTRCNNNGLLIIPISSTYFGHLFCPSSGALDCVTACGIMHPRCCRPVTSWVHYTTSCKHSLVLLRMGEIIARNTLSWLELLINRYCCI